MEKSVAYICLWFMVLLPSLLAAQDRIELGYQTTGRGIVWYRPGLPTYVPQWRFSRDTNKVMWVDTLTAIRYDWDYSDDVWRSEGTFGGALPPLPIQSSGSATVDNRTAYWLRDSFNLLHKYDSTAGAWTPWGDFFYLPDPPTDINAGASNGAARYRRSFWQDSDDNVPYYFDGAAWVPFGNATDEIQTYAHSGTTSYTNTLSLGGGSFTLQAGTGISVSTSGNTVTIAGTPGGGGGGGIYGDGTAGSGSDILPPGGSVVTIPGSWQPLSFSIDASSGNAYTALQVSGDLCGDDIAIKYLVGKSPVDSFQIYNLDCSTILKQAGGTSYLVVDSQNELYTYAGTTMDMNADSFRFQVVPDRTTMYSLMGLTSGAYANKIRGNSAGQILKWNTAGGGYWELGTDNAGSGVGGSGTANRLAYWTNSSTIAADDDATFDGTRMGVGTTTLTGRLNVNEGAGASDPITVNAYAQSSTTGTAWVNAANTTTTGAVAMAFTQSATMASVPAAVRRFGSAHSTRPGEFNVYTLGSDPLTLATNNTVRVEVTGAGVVRTAGLFGAGFSSTSTIHSTLQSNGSLGTVVNQATGNVTVTASHHTLIHTLNSTVNYTLPDPTTCAGRQYVIHHFGSSGNIGLNYNVVSSTGTTFNAVPARGWAWIISDGTNWRGYRLTST